MKTRLARTTEVRSYEMIGNPLPDEQAARASGKGITIATRKLGRLRQWARRSRAGKQIAARIFDSPRPLTRLLWSRGR